MTTCGSCRRLRELLEAEKEVLLKHLRNHLWFNQIEDENLGAMDFITQFGWLMREMYCGYSCVERGHCELAKPFLPGAVTRSPADGPAMSPAEGGAGAGVAGPAESLPVGAPSGSACPVAQHAVPADILARHLDQHKWFRRIPDADAGRRDFLERYGWLVREMYCGYACTSRRGCPGWNRGWGT